MWNKSFGQEDVQTIYKKLYSGYEQLLDVLTDKNQENLILELQSQTQKLERVTSKFNPKESSHNFSNRDVIIEELEAKLQSANLTIQELQLKNTDLQNSLLKLPKDANEKNQPIKAFHCKKAKKLSIGNSNPSLARSVTVDDALIEPKTPKSNLFLHPLHILAKKKKYISPLDCGSAIQDELENPHSRPKSPRPVRKQENLLDVELGTCQGALAKSLPLDSPC